MNTYNAGQVTTTTLLIAVIAAGALYVVGQYVGSEPQRVTQEQAAEREITVTGHGEVQTKPDVVRLTLGVQTGPQATATQALTLLTQRFTNVANALKTLGVLDDDIKTTNLSIQPTYDYAEGRQTLRGFEASESVIVTIRDLNRIGEILGRTTTEGVNQAGGITFEVDKPEKRTQEAQVAAIKDAHTKAQDLSQALDVRLGSVKKFSASATPTTPPVFFGGAAELKADAAGRANLPVAGGTQDITSDVSITYELR